MPVQHVFSKWKKTRILQNSSLKRFIPKTAVYSSSSLQELLNRYNMVYVKPDAGTHGKGVMRAKKRSKASFELREGVSSKVFRSMNQLQSGIKSRIGKRKYLVQQGIHMISHRGRKFDLRVLVQKNLNNQWEAMSILGRKAAANKIVTNVSNGGSMESLSTLLRPHMNQSSIRKLRRELNQMGLSVGKQLSTKYRGLKQLGLDIALDKNMRPWILEVNTSPAIYVYRTFNPSVYRRILRYAKAYGRFK
ncbi:YheC/YheD family protein [Paenibacillus dendritiformis]|uniref:YheC/YheD family protein n=1 Tax=Paenibacillus dendritiformis TaxID=130049 RepID=UPI001059F0BB|nr:YheC/YheD family protein [Paenibacillus dendritiformis]TDL49744.1 YheC/YheD family protein [Paenibacillus dendritiformis]